MSFASRVQGNLERGMLHFRMPKAIQRNTYHPISFFARSSSHLICGRVKRDPKPTMATFKPSFLGFCVLRSFTTRSKMLNQKNSFGETPLHVGVKIHSIHSRYEVCKQLLEAGADPNIPDNSGMTPLDSAILHCNQDMVELLISYGAVRSNQRDA